MVYICSKSVFRAASRRQAASCAGCLTRDNVPKEHGFHRSEAAIIGGLEVEHELSNRAIPSEGCFSITKRRLQSYSATPGVCSHQAPHWAETERLAVTVGLYLQKRPAGRALSKGWIRCNAETARNPMNLPGETKLG